MIQHFYSFRVGWVLLALAVTLTAAASSPKGVILFLIDDVGTESLEMYGGQTATPAMKRIADNGVKFDRFYAHPLCVPTRASLISGRYPFRNGMNRNIGVVEPDDNMDKSHCLIGNMFKQAGFHTAVTMKWGVGTPDMLDECGFDRFAVWQTGDTDRYYASEIFHNIQDLDSDTAMDEDAEWHELKRARGGDMYNMTLSSDVYTPHFAEHFAKTYIDHSLGRNKPFFLYYPMILAHSPHLEGLPQGVIARDESEAFHHQIETADAIIGAVMNHLEALGISDDVIVMALGDNGSPAQTESIFGEDGISYGGEKFSISERGTRVPSVLQYPAGVMSGQVATFLADVTDILPSLAEAVGQDLSFIPDPIDGVSFWGHIAKPDMYPDIEAQSRQWALAQRGNKIGLRFDDFWLSHRSELSIVDDATLNHQVMSEIMKCSKLQDDYENALAKLMLLSLQEPDLNINDNDAPTIIDTIPNCRRTKCQGTDLRCNTCDEGYRPTRSRLRCRPCKVENCANCKSSRRTCDECQVGFYLASSTQCSPYEF